MPPAEFLRLLFREGRAVLHNRPPPPGDADAAREVLRGAYHHTALALPGLSLPLHSDTAAAAADLLWFACWALAGDPLEDALEQCLTMPRPPASPAQHLSADLTLRFLPHLHRRAHAREPGGKVAELLAAVLRQWPLSGVLSAVEEPPTTAPEFGHDGLALLYAERWVDHPRPAWLPCGRGFESVELVWEELGKDLAALPPPAVLEALPADEGDPQGE